MEIISELPKEIKFNIFKYLQHPLAEIMREEIAEYENVINDDESYNFYNHWKYTNCLDTENEDEDDDDNFICIDCGDEFTPNEIEEMEYRRCRDCLRDNHSIDLDY